MSGVAVDSVAEFVGEDTVFLCGADVVAEADFCGGGFTSLVGLRGGR